MTNPSALRAFTDLGYGDKERDQGLPKLEFLAHYDPELLEAIVEQCRVSDPQIVELWRRWFETYPSRRIDSGPSEGHLSMFAMRYHLLPIALLVETNDSLLTVETLMGAAWLFMERTGSSWDTGKAFMIVVKLMPSGTSTSSSTEGIAKIKYVSSHIDKVVTLIPEVIDRRITSLGALQNLVRERFPIHEGIDSETYGATLDA